MLADIQYKARLASFGLAVPYIGTYRRQLPVSVERLYENAIDWAHLPYLHSSTFRHIECLEAGDWGFRARIWQRSREDGKSLIIELRLDSASRRWITRTLEGPGLGSEIWTHAFPVAERQTDIVVDFFVPGVTPDRVDYLREFYVGLYARLYDEDVWMMTVRQDRLDSLKEHRVDRAVEIHELGPLKELRARLPLIVEFGGRTFRLLEVEGELIAHSTICPHMLGPLEYGTLHESGIVECPWHGYRFDLRTRACVRGVRCSLAPAPMIRVDPATTNVTLIV